jgi:two-component system CheB/CheR fusion protein
VGASAGGLEAFSQLLGQLPSSPGFAIVLIQHLQPSHESELAEILGRTTSMPVVQAEHDMPIDSDHVYVIPPNVEMRMSGETFVLSPRPSGSTPSLTVDVFFTALAEQRGNQAIGVILSGSASDGTKGLAAIKAEGGIALVQDPATAAHRGMPESAIAAEVVDAVLPIEGIARELLRLAEHPYVREAGRAPAEEPATLSPDEDSALAEIVARLKRSTGLDLSHYKRPTLLRRIKRRMAMKHAATMTEYAALLETDSEESTMLLADVLVRVTSFFRDPEMFEALKVEAFPSIVARIKSDTPIRVWVPGCATGQEAYSIAIVLLEYLEASGSVAQVQIFASDLRDGDLAVARRGVYPAEIAAEMSPERLARFFPPVEDGYQVTKSLRDMCVFARHDITADPPFARLDLVSCRNLLIYLDNTLQRRVIGTLHYALVPEGCLVLGDSESTSAAPGLFRRTEHKSVLTRIPGDARSLAFGDFSRRHASSSSSARAGAPIDAEREREWNDAQRQLDAMLLDRFAPAAVLVDDKLQIKQIRGNAGEYLRLPPGDATLDLPSMISVGLASAVSSAIKESRESGRPSHRDSVRPRSEGGHVALSIAVLPIAAQDQPMSYAVLFDEGDTVSRAEGETGSEPSETEYLRQELEAATERLRILHEGRDAANESLRAANEEIQSSNEELQSMNEELDTAKEELQSTNEELTTLNDELQVRNTELAQRNDDLDNLLVSASIAMLVLDADLTIRRFTAEAARAFNLIAGDIGRKLTDMRWHLAIDDVGGLVNSVIRTGQPLEREVAGESGRWFRMTIRPYLRSGKGITGAIVTLLDIDALRRSQIVLERAALLNEGANRLNAALWSVNGATPSLPLALSILGDTLNASRAQLFVWENDAWSLLVDSPVSDPAPRPRPPTPTETEGLTSPPDTGQPLAEERRDGGELRIRAPLLDTHGAFVGVLRVEFDEARPDLDAAERDFASRATGTIALYLERERNAEILERLVSERLAELTETLDELDAASRVKNAFLANMSHELRTPLNSIIGFSSILLDGMAGELNGEQERQIAMVLSSGKHLLSIVSDLLDLEKMMAGAMPVTAEEFRLADAVHAVVELERPLAESKGIELQLPTVNQDIVMSSDQVKTHQILLNLLNNAIKFTDAGHIKVSAHADGESCVILVEDTGHGMTPEQLKLAFVEFEQVDLDPGQLKDGTGLGLSIARRLAELLGGSLTAKSTPGVGSTFKLVLALRLDPAESD